MLDSPLIRTLQLLDPEEFEQFYLFVASPIFNEATRFKDTLRLFEHIRLGYPAFTDEQLTKEEAGKALFPDRKNPVGEVEKAMSELMHILKQFINFRYSAVKGGKPVRRSSKKEFTEKPMLLLNFTRQQLALLRFYSERLHLKSVNASAKSAPQGKGQRVKRTENYFQNLYTELRELLDEQTKFDHYEGYEFSDFLFFRYLLEHEKALYDHHREEIEADLNMLAALEELDRFYLYSKLELMSRLVHYQNIAQMFANDPPKRQRLMANRDITLEMVELMRRHQYWQDTPGIALYTTLLEFLPENNEAGDLASDRFADMLARHIDALPKSRLDDFNVLLRSYWNRRYRHTKDPQFIGRLHGMHREQLQRLPANKNLPMIQVTNMLNTALKLNKVAWAVQFLREFAGAHNEEPGTKPPRGRPHPKYAVRIWWSMLYFTSGDYEKAAQAIPEYKKYSDVEDIYFFAVAAATDVKIQYERGGLDDHLIRNSLARIERNRDLPKERRDERLRFFKTARKLFNLKIKKETRRNADIAKELEAAQAMLDSNATVDWEWLEEKIGELS
ncbi:MAG: hypothetical protein KIS77_16515 [Saprospiraceae bacterium]|nr:hypothetical protein [Saprospiraceae bacterium]